MSKGSVFTTFFLGGAVTAALSACDVQVHDQTPDQYPANHDVGMYEIKATAQGIEGRFAASLPSGCQENASFSAVLVQ